MATNINHIITSIRDLRPGQRGLNSEKYTDADKGEPAVNKENQPLYTIWIGDKSGSIILVLWGSEWAHLQPGDMLKVTDGIANLRMNRLQISLDRRGKVRRFGEDLLLFSHKPMMSHVVWKQIENRKPIEWEPVGEERVQDWFSYPGTSLNAEVTPWKYNESSSRKKIKID